MLVWGDWGPRGVENQGFLARNPLDVQQENEMVSADGVEKLDDVMRPFGGAGRSQHSHREEKR